MFKYSTQHDTNPSADLGRSDIHILRYANDQALDSNDGIIITICNFIQYP